MHSPREEQHEWDRMNGEMSRNGRRRILVVAEPARNTFMYSSNSKVVFSDGGIGSYSRKAR